MFASLLARWSRHLGNHEDIQLDPWKVCMAITAMFALVMMGEKAEQEKKTRNGPFTVVIVKVLRQKEHRKKASGFLN